MPANQQQKPEYDECRSTAANPLCFSLRPILHNIANWIRDKRHEQKVTSSEAQASPVPSRRSETVQYRTISQQIADRSGDREGVETGNDKDTLFEEATKVTREDRLSFGLVL